jgi:nucleoside-diphosphate-sugar epimerase
MARRVLVLGATGFIGRNVATWLAARGDYDVVAHRFQRPEWHDPRIEWVAADLTEAGAARTLLDGVDIVVHAAAVTSGMRDIVERPHIHVTDNTVMNARLFEAAHAAGVSHLLFFSCSVMYPSSDIPLAENGFTGTVHPRYFAGAWTKLYAEKLAEFYAGQGRCKFTVLRHSNIYGPHDKYDLERSHMFGATVAKVMTTPNNEVVVWGEGREARDLLHADDLMDAVERALDAPPANGFALYNVGLGMAYPVRDVVRRIIAASGRKLVMTFDASRPTLDFSLALDSGRISRTLGWKPRIDLDEGIRRTLAWYREHHG